MHRKDPGMPSLLQQKQQQLRAAIPNLGKGADSGVQHCRIILFKITIVQHCRIILFKITIFQLKIMRNAKKCESIPDMQGEK